MIKILFWYITPIYVLNIFHLDQIFKNYNIFNSNDILRNKNTVNYPDDQTANLEIIMHI